MMTKHLIAAMFALVAVLCLGPASRAEEKDTKERLREDALLKEVQDLRQEVAKLRESLLQARVDLKELNDRLTRLEAKLDRLAADSTRRAMAFDPAQATGTLRLDNRLGVRALVTIDGRTYEVPPLSVRELPNQPAGAFTYEVTADGYGLGAPRRSTLAPRERLTVTIY